MRYGDAQRQWGAAVSLEITSYDDAPDMVHRQLKGPFDLWAGEWWRMPVSAFHHGDLVHLLLNCSAAWNSAGAACAMRCFSFLRS
jgi:membrane associated rhomboid family serine protease